MDLIKEIGSIAISDILNAMGGSGQLIKSVISVLKTGAIKHSGIDQDVKTHLLHALGHLVMGGIDEDGFSDKAHAIARLLLALYKAVRQ